jgi:hypothetical protein
VPQNVGDLKGRPPFGNSKSVGDLLSVYPAVLMPAPQRDQQIERFIRILLQKFWDLCTVMVALRHDFTQRRLSTSVFYVHILFLLSLMKKIPASK